MSGVEIRQRAASEGQRGGSRGQEGQPAPLYRASWSTVRFVVIFNNHTCMRTNSDDWKNLDKKFSMDPIGLTGP